MSDFSPTHISLLQGDANVAIAEVTGGVPELTFRVQLSGLTLEGRRVFSVYTTCSKNPSLEYIVAFQPSRPDEFDCSAALPELIRVEAFRRRVIQPVFDGMLPQA